MKRVFLGAMLLALKVSAAQAVEIKDLNITEANHQNVSDQTAVEAKASVNPVATATKQDLSVIHESFDGQQNFTEIRNNVESLKMSLKEAKNSDLEFESAAEKAKAQKKRNRQMRLLKRQLRQERQALKKALRKHTWEQKGERILPVY